ncbi:prenyltransferase/squalene oxidase repeat-containing protein [Fictibacillus sp. Mic-4]|uniref:terpene cyclase/mutase family protein n=1 Tax=Fictibacillus sp. Mic-4 TaxID=3132826 RepID=UPI003CED7D59
MNRLNKVKKEIERRCTELLRLQSEDGSWRFCFENVILTDAYMIIVMRMFEWKDETLMKRLVSRILSKQERDGTWKAYPDEKTGNLSATLEAYTALLYSGYVQPHSPMLKKAERFIRENGGIKKSGLLTRVFFCFNGLYPWPDVPINPTILFSLPKGSPLNFYDFTSYARAHFAPVMLGIHRKFTMINRWTPDLSHLNVNHKPSTLWEDLQDHYPGPKWQMKANRPLTSTDRLAEDYILDRIESDGTLLSYATSTFLMVYGLAAIGYEKDSPTIVRAIEGLISLQCKINGHIHIQNSPSTIWDTSLVNYALLSSGISPSHPQMKKTLLYLLKKQQTKPGDWIIHNRHALPGGWGFSESNSMHPDIDDTQAALRTLKRYSPYSSKVKRSYKKGLHWLLSMQNRDGGWAAFEKNTDKKWLSRLPIENAEDTLTDPSMPDLTGRTLEFLGNYEDMKLDHPIIKSAVQWLKKMQKKDGSWYGRWGICFIYGTWGAITGLRAAGTPIQDPSIQKGIKWLTAIQRLDGGWGESCESDIYKKYIPLSYSTVVQTAWALDALISVHPYPTEAIESGIDFLLNKENYTYEKTHYPTGEGLPGIFYMIYHSYSYIFPLLTLSHYYRKYKNVD